MRDIILLLNKTRKSYDGVTDAVRLDTVEIERGEFVSLLGPSGSGKTTTLMIIAGFEKLSSGDVVVSGRSVADVPPHERNIGVVFQNYALFPHMTVAENVHYPLRMRRVPRAEARERIARTLETVGLSGLAERYPRQLSGGQQQRVALARTLVYEPDLILLDEPLGALDKNLREHMQVEFKRIHRELGVTMIYVTHDQTEAMTMSDRIAVFNKGVIEQIGTPDDVYHRPTTSFVASFVGDSNIFEGVVAASGEGLVEVGGLGPVQTARRDLAAGARVSILMRPEIFRVTARKEGPPGSTSEILVEDAINYGDSRLILGRADGVPVRTRVPSLEGAAIVGGQRYALQWSPGHVHVIG